MSSGAVLVVPACEPGRGGGHLTRCMALVNDLRDLGREAWLFADRLLATADFDKSRIIPETGISDIQRFVCLCPKRKR